MSYAIRRRVGAVLAAVAVVISAEDARADEVTNREQDSMRLAAEIGPGWDVISVRGSPARVGAATKSVMVDDEPPGPVEAVVEGVVRRWGPRIGLPRSTKLVVERIVYWGADLIAVLHQDVGSVACESCRVVLTFETHGERLALRSVGSSIAIDVTSLAALESVTPHSESEARRTLERFIGGFGPGRFRVALRADGTARRAWLFDDPIAGADIVGFCRPLRQTYAVDADDLLLLEWTLAVSYTHLHQRFTCFITLDEPP